MSGNNTFELTGEQKNSIEKIAAEPTRAALIADTTGCFARGTEIWTPQGRRPIEVLRSGDDILVFDGTHVSVSQVEFMEVTSNQPKPMIEWSHETGKIRATYDHPFYDGERYIPLYQLAWREMGERQRVQLELLCQQYGQTLDNCPSRGLSHRDNEAGNRPFGALENCDGWDNYQSSSCGCANMDRKPRESAGSESSGLRSVKQPSRKFGVDNLGGEFSTCVQDGATTGFFGRSACQDCCRQEVFGRTTEVHLGRCSRPDYYGADKNIHRFRGSVSFCDAETDNKCLVQPSRLHGIQVLESEPYYAIGVRGDTKTYIVSDGFPVHNTGKTIVAVYTLLHPLVDAKKTLVICPVSTFDSWRDTLEDHAPHLPVFDVNAKTYASALKQWQDPEATGVWLIGREWFSTATTDLWHKKEVFQQGKLRKVDDKDKPPKRSAKWSWRKYGKLFDVIVYDEALALTTPIATPDGWKTVGDLRVGDFVFGDDGEPVEILRLTPIRYDAKTFRVHFDDGTYIDADAGHIWSAKPVGSTYSRPWREVTTGTIFDSNKEWTLPSHGAIQYPEKELPMDPYILGQWLGNGSKGQPHVWVRNELLDQTAQEFEARGTKTWSFGKTNHTRSVTRLHFSPFPMNLRDKELPIVYKYGSVSQRLDLLRGLMDSDGHVHKKNHIFTFTNTRLSLIEAVKEIVEGLGFKARVYGVQDNQYTINSCYRVVFSGTDFDPFLLRDVGHGGLANPHAPKIIRVEPIESVPVRCIEVDNESHLFLAGRSLHVTHNCHAASNRNSQNSASLRQIEPKRLKIAMSATYQGDKFQGAWAVCRWLWNDQTHEDGTPIVDGSFWRWANQWATVEFSAFAEGGKQVGAERNPGAFVKSLPCYTRTVTAKKPYQIYRCPLQLGPVQAQQYNSMRDTSIAWLNDHPLVADLPIVQKTRLRQMLLGTIDLSDEDEVVFPEDTVSVKFEALLKIIEREPGEKILVFVDSKKIPPIFSDRLNQQGLKAAHWTGGVSKVRRAKIKERFMLPYDDPDAVNFLVASTTSISDGTNGLQWVCHTEVWLSKAMSGIKNEQAEGRLNRRGQKAERITRYELFVPGTADDEDYERNARKALMRSQELAIL